MLFADDAALASLTYGGDSRTLAPYGVTVPAAHGLIALGSCTANPIGAETLARYRQLGPDTMLDPAEVLRVRFGAAYCQLAASGTDAEYTVALSMGCRPYRVLLMDPREVGTGTLNAATGLPHTPGGAVSQALGLQVQASTIPLRDGDGQPLLLAQVDRHAISQASSLGGPLLVHHVPCTKTGLMAPSESACRQIQADNPQARIVVDNVQARHAPGDVERWLGWGWAVMISGSKFLGAPPFCGATLFPEDWLPASRPAAFSTCPGVKHRWHMALALLDAPAALPAWIDAVSHALIPAIGESRIDGSFWRSRSGILAFDLGLSLERSQEFHRKLIGLGFFIGQPVRAGARALLRVAPGARMDMTIAGASLEKLAGVMVNLRAFG